jgi:hypothetical protein
MSVIEQRRRILSVQRLETKQKQEKKADDQEARSHKSHQW